MSCLHGAVAPRAPRFRHRAARLACHALTRHPRSNAVWTAHSAFTHCTINPLPPSVAPAASTSFYTALAFREFSHPDHVQGTCLSAKCLSRRRDNLRVPSPRGRPRRVGPAFGNHRCRHKPHERVARVQREAAGAVLVVDARASLVQAFTPTRALTPPHSKPHFHPLFHPASPLTVPYSQPSSPPIA